MAGSAFVNSNPNGSILRNNSDVVLLRLGLPVPGDFVIFGRVVIFNTDLDPQPASARITSNDGANLIDSTQFIIPGAGAQPIFLQGTARVQPGQPQIVDIRGSTYDGLSMYLSLFAIPVDGLRSD